MLVYSEEGNDACEKEAKKERSLISAMGSRDRKKAREEEEPLICPVTGLGQLICWC